MRFDLTPPPAPTWDSHLSDDVRAEVATGHDVAMTLADELRRACVDQWLARLAVSEFAQTVFGMGMREHPSPTIYQRDPGDEQP